MTDLERHEYDVIVIGAGGAGLRAAIEARAAGASVGLVCKSLLGKAHTVMAEGGVAAALGNVAEADSWQVHFRDTMVGGKLLNEPRMVSRKCTIQLSREFTLPIAAAAPPSAMTVCALPKSDFEMIAVFLPARRASIAARRPAPPAPITTTS